MLMIGLAGPGLLTEERRWLQHNAVAGVVLFRRNIQELQQVLALTQAIRAATARPLLIAVDQEGGRVQRLMTGYTALPPLRDIGRCYAQDPVKGLQMARDHAWLMAQEVRCSGIDLSFAPVADLDCGNQAIGDRSFSADPQVVTELIGAYIHGMHAANMPATLKHFPGHGSAREDTHHSQAVDHRPYQTIQMRDLRPFAAGITAGADAVMMGYVNYPSMDSEPAGFSSFWIETVLRQRLQFRGVVFSDDIAMAAAMPGRTIGQRVQAHLQAGCDVVLACQPDCVDDSLAVMHPQQSNTVALLGLLGRGPMGWSGLLADDRYQTLQMQLNSQIKRGC